MNPTDLLDYTPLHTAAEENNVEVAKYLLQQGADITAIAKDGSTPLHVAFLQECMPMIDLFLSALEIPLKNVNLVNKAGLSYFHIACSKNDPNIIQLFLNHGAEVNRAIHFDSWKFRGFTPLHIAVQFECTKIIQLLINYGADITAKEENGLTPLLLAFMNKSRNVIDLLLTDSSCGKVENPTNKDGFSHFHIACIYSKLTTVKCFIDNGVSIDNSVSKESPIYAGYTALHFAAKFEQVDIAEILLQRNAKVDARDIQGITPLHLACQQNVDKICNLIQQNVQVDRRMHHYLLEENINEIADWFNNRKQYIEMIDLLLKHNSDVNCTDYCGRTPLYYACEISTQIIDKLGIQVTGALMNKLEDIRSEMINILLQHNADISSCNDFTGETILYHLIDVNESLFFVDISKAKIAELFLSRGADANIKSCSGLTLLQLAINKGFTKVVEVLLKYKADVNVIESENLVTPLHKASENLNLEIIQMLIDNNCNVHARKKDGKTALHDLVSSSKINFEDSKADSLIEIMECFLKCGCDINVQDNEGKTPLHIACSALNYVGVHTLLENGADLNIEDDCGRTPLSCCLYRCRGNFHEIYICLDNHVNKLRYIGYYISKKNQVNFQKIRNMHEKYFKNDEFLITEYEKEFKVMKYKKIGSSSLYDMLNKDLNELALYVRNKTFKKIITAKKFKDKFPLFGYLLKLQFKKGCIRADLLKYAKDALEYLVNYRLPEICSDKILKHLNNENLNSLIRAKNIIIS